MENTLADSLKEVMWTALALSALIVLVGLWRLTGDVNRSIREEAKNGEITRVNRSTDFQDTSYGFTPEQSALQISDFYGQYPDAAARVDGTLVRRGANLETIRRMFNSSYTYSRNYVFDSNGVPVEVNYTIIR